MDTGSSEVPYLCTPQVSPTFQQLPQLLLLLSNLIQEELGVEVANFGWGQAATCTVLSPVEDGRQSGMSYKVDLREGQLPPPAPSWSQTPSLG